MVHISFKQFLVKNIPQVLKLRNINIFHGKILMSSFFPFEGANTDPVTCSKCMFPIITPSKSCPHSPLIILYLLLGVLMELKDINCVSHKQMSFPKAIKNSCSIIGAIPWDGCFSFSISQKQVKLWELD